MSGPLIDFIKSAVEPVDYPQTSKPEVVIFGRSNVGKSTFINALFNRRVARASTTPGRTRLLNFFDAGKYILVDAPGYGYAKMSKEDIVSINKMVNVYLGNRAELKLIILLIDSRHPIQSNDKSMLEEIEKSGFDYLVIATKYDKTNSRERSLHLNSIKGFSFYPHNYLISNLLDKESYQLIAKRIEETLL